jgi:hypothetical protein
MDEKSSAPAYEIEDIYNTFNCNSVPLQYRDQASRSCNYSPTSPTSSTSTTSSTSPTSPPGDVNIKISTAQDFEKMLSDNVVGDNIISKDVCFPSSSIIGGNPLTKTYQKVDEYYQDNKELIIEMIKQFGLFIAIAQIHIMFATMVFVFPGVFDSDEWQSKKSGFTTLQIFGEFVLGEIVKISKLALDAAKPGFKALAKSSEGSIMKVSNNLAMKISQKVSSRVLVVFTKVMQAAVKIFDVLGYVQILLTIVDAFDLCKVMTTNMNLSQSVLDMQKKMSDYYFTTSTGFNLLYPNVWDPFRNHCDYDLDPRTCSNKFKDCKKQIFKKGQKWGDGKKFIASPGSKTEITEDEYCGDVFKKYQDYQNEYFNALKVNSVGQCISEISNKEIAEKLKAYIGDELPEVDFDSLIGINKDNYPEDLFPTSDFAKQFSIFLVNQNSFAAQFVKDNIYYFISVFIILVLIILLV